MVSVPFGTSEPAIQRFRAVTGLAGVRNQVPRPPSAIVLQRMLDLARRDQHMRADVVAILAASILVNMPPRGNSDSAAPAIASISEVSDSGRSVSSLALELAPGGALSEAVDVG